MPLCLIQDFAVAPLKFDGFVLKSKVLLFGVSCSEALSNYALHKSRTLMGKCARKYGFLRAGTFLANFVLADILLLSLFWGAHL